MAVSHAQGIGSFVYIDGTGTLTNPYTCINVTSNHPGIFVNRSISLIGYNFPVFIECGHEQGLTFEAKSGSDLLVKLAGLVLLNSLIKVVDSSIDIDNCQFLGDKQPISVMQDTQSIQITVSNSTCMNTPSFLSVEIKGRNVSGSNVQVKISDSNIQGLKSFYPTPPPTALMVQSTNNHLTPELISFDIHLQNVSFVSNMLSTNGLIYVNLKGVLCNIKIDKVLFTKSKHIARSGIVRIIGPNQLNVLITNIISMSNPYLQCIYLDSPSGNATVRINNSSFTDHKSLGGGAVLYINSLYEAKLKVESSTFKRNIAEGSSSSRGGCFSVTGQTVTAIIEDSEFFECSGIAASGVGDFTAVGTLTVVLNSSRVNGCSTQGVGGVLGCHGHTVNMSIKNTSITKSRAVGPGGFIAIGEGLGGMCVNVDIELDSVFVSECFSISGWGGFIAAAFYGQGPLRISNCVFKSISAYGPGGVISAKEEGHLLVYLSNTTLQDCYTPAMGGMLFANNVDIVIHDCVFQNNSAKGGPGGVCYLDNLKTLYITITDSIFMSDTSIYPGGAIYADLPLNQARVNISNSTFTNCTGRVGGAVSLTLGSQSNVTISSCKFVNNSSPTAPGGGIYIETAGDKLVDAGCVRKSSTHVKYRKWMHSSLIRILDTEFIGNVALLGGACYFAQGEVHLQRCRFVDNFASAGSGHVEIHEDSTGVVVLDSRFQQNRNTKYHQGVTYSTATFISTESTAPIVFQNTTLDLRTMGESDTILRFSKGGEVEFNDSMIYCPIGSSLTVFNFTNKITQNCTIWITSLQFDCHACANGLYSLLRGHSNGTAPTSGLQCLSCPFGASCAGYIKANDGFFGYPVQDFPPALNFTVCPVGYCKSPPPYSTMYNACSGSRSGTLCGVCNQGYTETLLSSECMPREACTDTWFWGVAIVFSLLMALYLIVKPPVFGFLLRHIFWVRFQLRDEACVTHDKTCVTHDVSKYPGVTYDKGYLKILFYFYQVASLLLVSKSCAASELERIPLSFPWIERRHQTAFHGKPSSSSTPDGPPVVYCPSCIACHHQTPSPSNGPYLGAVIETLLLGYAVLATTSLKLLQCVPLSTRPRLFIQGEVPCYQWWQYTLMGFVCVNLVPFVVYLAFCSRWLDKGTISASELVAGCILPLPYLSYRLLRHLFGYSHNLNGTYTDATWKPSVERVLYGPFLHPIAPSGGVKYWESVLIGRRLVLITIYVSITDALTRQIALNLVCMLILFHHSLVRPFRDLKANVAEAVSLLCLVIIALANVLPACFISLGQEPRGRFRSLIAACDWLEVSLLAIVPILFLLMAVISVLSQVLRLIWIVLSFLCCKLWKNKEPQPLLEVTNHNEDSVGS
ncbi:predicted protein [Nematostella vectensis]|uniref:Right handed beta helix domain-containing protein n=1 Tax=Nematostella vectensis TaxID=45351 RepID=A7REW9_NEMVE|nr:predicted protein [Nematostella vectensis]|eukprot:XP_001642049.1 predicted protein [Nematostella vectensis]